MKEGGGGNVDCKWNGEETTEWMSDWRNEGGDIRSINYCATDSEWMGEGKKCISCERCSCFPGNGNMEPGNYQLLR